MKKHELSLTYLEYDQGEVLPEPDRELIGLAGEAAARAYAPYSRFRVGAAVRLANGLVVTGNNQENAAYPSGLCAERVALFNAASANPGVAMTAIAIVGMKDGRHSAPPVPPCGACRQVMAEYESLSGTPIRILMAGSNGKILVMEGTSTLLPMMFTKHDLNP